MAVRSASNATALSQNDIIRRYYTEIDYLLSPEGILKALSAIICIATSAVFLAGGMCSGAPRLLDTMNIVLMVCGASVCFTYATVLLELPQYVPQCWLYTDIILSAVTGVLMMVIALLSLFFCAMNDVINSMYFPMVLLTAVLLTASTVIMYMNVMRQTDLAAIEQQPTPLPTSEQEV